MEQKIVLDALIEEYGALKEKCTKLEKFLNDENKVKSVGCNQSYLLDRQLDAMNLYLYFLGERIDDLEKEDSIEDTEEASENEEVKEENISTHAIKDIIEDFFHTDNSLDVLKGLKVSFVFN